MRTAFINRSAFSRGRKPCLRQQNNAPLCSWRVRALSKVEPRRVPRICEEKLGYAGKVSASAPMARGSFHVVTRNAVVPSRLPKKPRVFSFFRLGHCYLKRGSRNVAYDMNANHKKCLNAVPDRIFFDTSLPHIDDILGDKLT